MDAFLKAVDVISAAPLPDNVLDHIARRTAYWRDGGAV